MNTLLSPPPERSLPHHQRRRAKLLRIIDHERAVRPRRPVVPIVAAASVAALTVGGTVVVQNIGRVSDSGIGPAGSLPQGGTEVTEQPTSEPTSSPGGEPTGESRGKPTLAAYEPAPVARELSHQETRDYLRDCASGAPGMFDGHVPYVGITLPEEHRPWVSASWLVTRKGREYVVCVRDGRGNPLSSSAFGSAAAKDIPHLFAPVDMRSDGFGLVTRPVATVTVQAKGEPEREAVLRNGFWFAPVPDPPGRTSQVGPESTPDEDDLVIGINPPGTILRGYDTDGTLVYDSSKTGPTVEECYTDPDGREVIVHNGIENPTPGTCRRTLTWEH
ncbi:hypothetical protein [Actinopolymorpha sp. B9G3]|uniref:hypothetical protein n=1 Tax=Actinopolymorpha sp. B9G3 TaxID=3158970 RepID=UPI0032D9A896